MRICVTGASGRAGQVVVQDLLDHGHKVIAVDVAPWHPRRGPAPLQILRADLTDYGQAAEALDGADAVVHLANIPAPGLAVPAVTFNQNMAMNFNVFHAAAKAGLERVVWASSETTLGLPFDTPPRYAPVDEDHYPFPTTTYALSKVASETIATQIAGWSGIPFVALRFSNVLGPSEYEAQFPSAWEDPSLRKWNLWSYIDDRDAAQACRLALTADVTGSESFIIAAADTVMTRPSADLMAEIYPGVPLRAEVTGHQSLLCSERARHHLGFVPQHTWRDEPLASLEQSQRVVLGAAHAVVVEGDAPDAPVGRQRAGLRLDLLGREHTVHRRQQRVPVQQRQVPGELLHPVDLAAPLDLDGHTLP
jgi:nucleoside-diphosphate-sugar epimerase